MARIRVSTTVDSDLLDAGRKVNAGGTDASLLDAALQALVAVHRAAAVDVSYAAYDDQPLSVSDEWGDLASFRQAASRS